MGFEGIVESFEAPNLKSALETPKIVDRKLAKELGSKRLAGPFDNPPFAKFRTSPIGLVPKKNPGEFRLIHHLSFPKGSSVNDGIPDYKCTVKYATIDTAIQMIKKLGQGCFLAKTDIESAFRLLPVHPSDYHLLGIKWREKYYYDLCLPMGCSSSCNLFERFSTSLEWIAKNRLNIQCVAHVLDDFLFVTKSLPEGHSALKKFKALCDILGVPLVDDKTVGPLQVLAFVGFELDTLLMEARLPQDKLVKCRDLIKVFLAKEKANLCEIQSLIGLLNFAVCVVAPGRPFLRRMINLTIGLKKPYHHRRINKEVKADLQVWLDFLTHFNGRSFFLEDKFHTSESLHLFTDSSTTIGFGVVFGSHWAYGCWDEVYKSFNIAILEFYPILLAVCL